jgi:hypothetical protein
MVLNAPSRSYQRCTRCVMDTTDPEIRFDAAGVCNHCTGFDTVTRQHWFPARKARGAGRASWRS